MTNRLLITPLAVALSGPVSAAAPETAAEPVYPVAEIIVTEERPRVADQATTIDIVSALDIERRGARTLDEALVLLPGLYVRFGADGAPRIDVRGMRTRNILLLQDGVLLNSSFDGQFDPAALPVDNIAMIKMTRGGSSVLYGPGGNAGVIEIITKSGTAEPAAEVLAEGTDSDAYLARSAVGGRVGEVGIALSGSLYDRDDFPTADDFVPTPLEDGGDRLNSDRRDRAVQTTLVHDAGGAATTGLSLSWRASDYGKPPTTTDNQLSDFGNRARYERVDFESFAAQLGGHYGLDADLSLRPSAYYRRSTEDTANHDDATFTTQEEPGAFQENATTEVYGAGLIGALASGAISRSSVALSAREERWDADGFSVSAGGGGGGGGGTVVEPIATDESVRIYSAAFEQEFGVGEDFAGFAGVGYAYQDRRSSGDGDPTFALGGRYAVSSTATLRANVARQVRFPTLRDLYAVDRGNPELEPEKTWSYEIGWEQSLASDRVFLETVLFRLDAEDFIERESEGTTQNFEEYRFQGVELSTRWEPFERMSARLGYTWLDSENRSPGADTDTLQNRPEHKLTLTTDYTFEFGLRLGLAWLHVADSYTLSRTAPTVARKLPDYDVLDVAASQPLSGGRGRIYLRVENLLDENYEESFGFPQPGRQFVLGAELRL